jgi:hypothetical protein
MGRGREMRGRIRWSDVATAVVAAAVLPLGACRDAAGGGVVAGTVVTVAADSASNPTVAADPGDGRVHVAWVGVEDGRHAVLVAALGEEEADPRKAVRANDIPGDVAPHLQASAQVAVGPEGNVYVLWQNNTPVEGRRFPASDLRLAVSTDGGRSFSAAITVNDDAGGPPSSHTFHDLTIADDGTVLVSWIDSRERDAAVAAGRGDVPGSEIRVARSLDGGRSFGSSVVVDAGSCPCCRTSVAVAPDGAVYVAWRKIFPGEVRDVVVARAEPGSLVFGEPVRVHDDGWVFPGCPHAGPSLAVADDGTLLVGWYTGKEGRQGLWYASSSDGARSFSSPIPVLTDDFVPPSQLRLATGGGRVWAAWDDRRTETPRVRVAAGAVGERLRSAPGAVAGTDPEIAATAAGAVVAWLDGGAVRTMWMRR